MNLYSKACIVKKGDVGIAHAAVAAVGILGGVQYGYFQISIAELVVALEWSLEWVGTQWRKVSRGATAIAIICRAGGWGGDAFSFCGGGLKIVAFGGDGILISGVGFQVGDDLTGGKGVVWPVVFAFFSDVYREACVVRGIVPGYFDSVGVQYFCAYVGERCTGVSVLKPVGFAIALVFEEVCAADVVGTDSERRISFRE